VSSARAGDDTAFSQLIDLHQDSLYGYLVFVLGDLDHAEELAQEVFVRAFQRLGEYTPAQKFSSWLYQIATDLLRDYQCRQATDLKGSWGLECLPADSRAFSLFTSPSAGEDDRVQQYLWRSLGKIPALLRQALLLHDRQGLTYDEVALVLDCAPATVQRMIQMARTRLLQSMRGMTSWGRPLVLADTITLG
jgi:RNA polymerase sigma-70 factor (ECF subfamily)